MADYKVRWEIEVEANSPREAAEVALMIQRDPNSIALEFNVSQRSKNIDLWEPTS